MYLYICRYVYQLRCPLVVDPPKSMEADVKTHYPALLMMSTPPPPCPSELPYTIESP